MPRVATEGARTRRVRTNRLEALSDGVFAFAITLLVLELAVPAGSEHDLLHAIAEQWPSYLGYVVSFATIGAIWVGHSAVTEFLEYADIRMTRLNLLLLFTIAFLPFPTRLLAQYIRESGAERVAATFYGVCLLMTSVLLSLLWRYAVRAKLIHPDASEGEVQVLTARLTPGAVGYAAVIALGLFVPVAAVVGYLVIAVYYLKPSGIVGRRHHGPT
jgi:TMEM175 potassium channel family protein